MRKPVFSVMLILLLLAGLVVATGAAGSEEVNVTLWWDGETTIGEGQVAVLRAGWGACSPGLVRAFTTAINFEVMLDGEQLLMPEDVDDLWGAIEIYDDPPSPFEACLGKAPRARAQWRYVLDDLPAGTYEVRTWWWMHHTVTDGGDTDGDGKPDLFTPENFYGETVNTIIIE
jgi:hypothetical protein